MNNLTLRAISGAIFVALVVVCLLGGTWPAWSMLLLFTFLSLREYQNLLLPNLTLVQKLVFIISGCYLFAVSNHLWDGSIARLLMGFGGAFDYTSV